MEINTSDTHNLPKIGDITRSNSNQELDRTTMQESSIHDAGTSSNPMNMNVIIS